MEGQGSCCRGGSGTPPEGLLSSYGVGEGAKVGSLEVRASSSLVVEGRPGTCLVSRKDPPEKNKCNAIKYEVILNNLLIKWHLSC